MGRVIMALAPAAAFAAAMTGQAGAQPSEASPIPQCARTLGSLAIVDGDQQGWTAHNLSSPQAMLRAVVQRSRCFTLAESGANRAAGAEYVLVAEVAEGGERRGGIRGFLGNVVGGRFGALGRGVREQREGAQAVLSLTNVRTSETVAATSRAQSGDTGAAAAGPSLSGAVGAWEDTAEGRVISRAFIEAYAQLVAQLGGLDPNPAGTAR